MRAASVVFAIWAALLAVVALIGWLIFFRITTPWGWLFVALPGFAVLITAGTAAVARASRRGTEREVAAPVRLDELSFPSAALAIALVAILLGLAVGAWLWLMGAALALASGLGLVRELRGARALDRENAVGATDPEGCA